MMFLTELWIAIAITLLIAVLVTLSLNFVSEKVRNVILGHNIQSPTMNIVSIFLTGGQFRTPRRSFPRFLFMLFVVWSLIIRTCHQSMLFELMQADLRRPTIKTLDELFKSDLTYHDYDSWKNHVLNFDLRERLMDPLTRFVIHEVKNLQKIPLISD